VTPDMVFTFTFTLNCADMQVGKDVRLFRNVLKTF